MRLYALALLALVGLICFAGCGAAGSASEVGISKVPVMPGSTLMEQDSGGASVGDTMSSLYDVTTTWWTYEVDATAEEIKAFYLTKFTDVYVDEEPGDADDETSIMLIIGTTDTRIDELVIEIYDNSYSISETVKD